MHAEKKEKKKGVKYYSNTLKNKGLMTVPEQYLDVLESIRQKVL